MKKNVLLALLSIALCSSTDLIAQVGKPWLIGGNNLQETGASVPIIILLWDLEQMASNGPGSRPTDYLVLTHQPLTVL